MLTMIRRKKIAPPAPEQTLQAAVVDAGTQAVSRLAELGAGLAVDAAEVHGMIDATHKASGRQAEALQRVSASIAGVQHSQEAIGVSTNASREAMREARAAVDAVGAEVTGVVETLQRVAEAAHKITQIAKQTRLVAFNASVEAKRAGESGRGFSVVADAVKDLAGKVELSSKDIMRTVGDLDRRIEVLTQELRGAANEEAVQSSQFRTALGEVDAGVTRIEGQAEHSRTLCGGMQQHADALAGETQQGLAAQQRALTGAEGFRRLSGDFIELLAGCGVETEDTAFIRGTQDLALAVGRTMEAAINSGALREEDLFDEQYRPIPGVDPPQFTTRFTSAAPAMIQPLLEAILSPRIPTCIVVDRNGYAPTHIPKLSQPPRVNPPDPDWNAANSRCRRMFNEGSGLLAARSKKPFMVQIDRRAMGGGKISPVKDICAPIYVNGRHWGAVRLGVQC